MQRSRSWTYILLISMLAVLVCGCEQEGRRSKASSPAAVEQVARAAGLDADIRYELREWLAAGLHKAFAVDPFDRHRYLSAIESETPEQARREAMPDGGFVLFAIDDVVVWSEELAKHLASPLGKGRSQYEDGRYEEAAATLARAAAGAPDDWYVQNRYGWALFMAGDWQTAVEAFGVATSRNPVSVGSWQGLMQAQYALGEYEAAAKAAMRGREVTDSEAQKSTFALNAAYAFVAQGNYNRASELAGRRPALGMQVQGTLKGLTVATVFKGGPADLAGVRQGDVLLHFNGGKVPALPQDFIEANLRGDMFGQSLPFRVVRNGDTLAGEIVVGIPADLPERYDASKALRPE